MNSSSGDLDLDRVIAEIQATVAENTASGVYTETLEDELRSHFARLLERQELDQFGAVWTAVDDLETLRSLPGRAPHTASRVPGGELVHKAAGRLVDRKLQEVVDRSDLMWQATILALRSIASLLDEPVSHTHVELIHEIDTLQDRVAALERQVGRADAILNEIDAVDELPSLKGALQLRFDDRSDEIRDLLNRLAFAPTYSTAAFNEISRGDRESIREEYRPLADRLADVPGPVLDIGAGRGELLELLRERGVEAWGVETDAELVASGARLGIDLREMDGLHALRAAESGSLGAITMIHVIEHLHPNELLASLEQAREKLAPDGLLVLETPNPQSLYTFARAFWLDPTHLRPIHPTFLEFVLAHAGFRDLEFEWTAFPPNDERLLTVPGNDPATETINENIRRLNQLVFAAQNYRVVATR